MFLCFDIFMKFKSGIKIIGSAIVVLGILLYAYSRIESFARGPQITIASPSNGSTVFLPLLSILGTIKQASHITLNGRQVYTDEAGGLKERIVLADGYNIIELNASDRFGRTTKKILEIIYR